jgi:hypothetical protein
MLFNLDLELQAVPGDLAHDEWTAGLKVFSELSLPDNDYTGLSLLGYPQLTSNISFDDINKETLAEWTHEAIADSISDSTLPSTASTPVSSTRWAYQYDEFASSLSTNWTEQNRAEEVTTISDNKSRTFRDIDCESDSEESTFSLQLSTTSNSNKWNRYGQSMPPRRKASENARKLLLTWLVLHRSE